MEVQTPDYNPTPWTGDLQGFRRWGSIKAWLLFKTRAVWVGRDLRGHLSPHTSPVLLSLVSQKVPVMTQGAICERRAAAREPGHEIHLHLR